MDDELIVSRFRWRFFQLRTWIWDSWGIRKCRRSDFRGSLWIWNCRWKSFFFSSWNLSLEKSTFMNFRINSQKYFSEFVKFLKFKDFLYDVKSPFTYEIKSALLSFWRNIFRRIHNWLTRRNLFFFNTDNSALN